MGRHKRTVPNGKFRLKVDGKPQSDKLYQVNIEYTWGGTPIRVATGVKARIGDWNKKGNLGRGELRASFGEEFKRTNAMLNKRLAKIDADLQEYNIKHPNQINEDVIRGFMQDKPLLRLDGGRDFVEFALGRLASDLSRNKIGQSRYNNGVSALRMFSEFLASTQQGTYKKDGIFVGEINCDLLQKHINWRRVVKKNADETINHALTPILKACNYACSLGYLDKTKNTRLQDMRIVIKADIDEESQKFDGKSLSKEQLVRLIEIYDKCEEPRRKDFIEMFLFAFHACGLRVIDIMTLQWASIDFEKKELRKTLVKTNNRHTIPLSEAAISILTRWKEKGRRKRFVFDLVGDDLDLSDAEAIYKARNNATKCIDQSLIVVGEQMNLPFKLTMHVARHTFAVCALNDGMNISVVSRLLGHSSTDTTEKVYAKFLPATLSEELAKLHYTYLPQFT